jgi:hypothetical protein
MTGLGGNILVREPAGVVGAITPFNYPFQLNLFKATPALAAGCTIVLKPHPWTPLDAFEIARAATDAGVPAGVLNVVPGGAEAGSGLTGSPMVDVITFTGSTPTGRRIMASAAGTIKRVKLELGGKSARIVLGDVSEAYAATIGFTDVLAHCGQGCVLESRLLLPERLREAYVDGVHKAFADVRIGDPRDEATTLGPLIRAAHRDRVDELVRSGVAEGARVLVGGKRPADQPRGYFYEPTVLMDARNDMRVAQEEIFGPVLTVIGYDGTDTEAVRLAKRQHLRAGRRRRLERHQPGVQRRAADPDRNDLGADRGPRLRRACRRGSPGTGVGRPPGPDRLQRRLRRVQAERHRTGVGRARAGRVHRAQGHDLELTAAGGWPPWRVGHALTTTPASASSSISAVAKPQSSRARRVCSPGSGAPAGWAAGVRPKRGAGAGCAIPSTVTKPCRSRVRG